ncbi:hypothetical protein ACV0BM_008655 [Elizabethkingia meningoseptica]|uniref:hypothetical protein n=1 Tax=Elizabethkingia meningoseptica TaxID=238 RepID=UPI0020127012|nr:hypothetical protein [Elizabethkingia meningoseptica]MCL1675999.1 hypothetical protein [Elizabethkingia meningoseptica]MCL1686355.1 hypothetical protein [Elizabethkingia meningoseptica]
MKKLFFLSVICLILASCSISYTEPYADVWDINPQKKIILSPNNTKVYDFDLVNISSENNLLQIYAGNGKLLKTIGKGEKARFKEISLNGIIIENNSNNKGSVQFYSKERGFKLPKLRIETKETE